MEGRSGLGFRRARGDKKPEVGSILNTARDPRAEAKTPELKPKS